MNCASHNFAGHLGTYISANFCASIPNFRVCEIDYEDVPWKDALISKPPVFEDGRVLIPTAPGWGGDLNEEVARAHVWERGLFPGYWPGGSRR